MSDTFIFTELGEKENFAPLSISNDSPFTQSREYGEWQKGLGREIKRFLIKNKNAEIVGFFQLIKFGLPFGKNILYSPYGPVISNLSDKASDSPESFSKLLSELKKYLVNLYGNKNTVFIKLDFSLTNKTGSTEIFKKYFKKPPKSTFHAAYMQPRAEWYLDLENSEENLLKKMHEKTRYVINLAARKGIVTEIIETDFKKYFEKFYSLLKETADRNKFYLHPKKYYKSIFDEIEKNGLAFLSIAKYEDKILVINLVKKYGDVAHFIFGGSSSDQRNLSPSHRAHWAAIVHAKKIGCKSYNFGGVTEESAGSEGKREDLASLSSFKKKFGGHSMLHTHCYDLILKPSWYYLYVLRKILKSVVQ